MDMGAGQAFESLILGGAVVGVLCVLPMVVIFTAIIFILWSQRKRD